MTIFKESYERNPAYLKKIADDCERDGNVNAAALFRQLAASQTRHNEAFAKTGVVFVYDDPPAEEQS